MIFDSIENKNHYISLNKNFEKAFKFIENNNLEEVSNGRYEIDGDNVFVLIQSYTSRQEKENKWESHRKYIDIQYILRGTEIIGFKPVRQLIKNEDYFKEEDIAFYKPVYNWTKLEVEKGQFVIFFPTDGHKPCCINEKAELVKKAVIKICI